MSQNSSWRKILSRALFVLVLPVLFLGLIDPLEGGLALLLAGAIYLAAFLLAGYGPKRVLWVPYLASILIGTVVLVLAIFGFDRVDNEPSLIPLAVGNWIYRFAVVSTLVGGVITAVQSFRPGDSSVTKG